MENFENMEHTWGSLNDDEKISRMVKFMNKFVDDTDRKKIVGASRYTKSNGVPWMALRALNDLGWAKEISKGNWKVMYSKNEVKQFTRAKELIARMKDIQNNYTKAQTAKKKAEKEQKKKINAIEASRPNMDQEVTKEKKVARIALESIEKAVPDIIEKVTPEIVKKIRIDVDVTFSIRWK